MDDCVIPDRINYPLDISNFKKAEMHWKAVTEEEVLEHLCEFKEKWGGQYPSCGKKLGR